MDQMSTIRGKANWKKAFESVIYAIRMAVSERRARPPDGGYGWVVVTASFLLQTISGGIAFSVGIYYVEFLESFKESKGDTAWVGSINTGLLFGGGPIASILANKYGHRSVVILGSLMSGVGLFWSAFTTNLYVLYISYGLLAGLGFCFIYVPSVVIVGLYFEKRRNFCMALASTGFAVGNFLYGPFLHWMIGYYGWRGALIISSGFCFQCCVLGAFLAPVDLWATGWDVFEYVKPKEEWSLSKLLNVSLIKDIKFIIFLTNNVLWNIGSLMLLVICTDYARSVNIPKDQSILLVTTVGMGSLVGRVIVAFTASIPRCNSFLVFIISTAASGLAIGFYPIHDSFMSLVTCSAMYGIAFGAQVGVLAVVTSDLFGIERLTSAYGYLMFGNGVGAAIGPPVAGWVFDVTGSYEIAFVCGGALTVVSAIILIAIPIIHAKEKSDAIPPKYISPDGTVTMSNLAIYSRLSLQGTFTANGLAYSTGHLSNLKKSSSEIHSRSSCSLV